MEDIKLIIKDNKIKITVAENLSNSKFLEFLKIKLERIFFYSNERKYITLELYSRNLSNKEVLTLFDIFESFKNFIIDKINCTKKIKEEVVIVKGNIRNGEVRVYNKSVLLIGGINRGGKIIVCGSLYVLGRVYGDIEIKSSTGKVYCENIYNSLVKIGGVYKIYTDDLYDKEIFLDETIKEKDYKIGGYNSGKSNSCYIW